jgi:precorrin-6B methylase 2
VDISVGLELLLLFDCGDVFAIEREILGVILRQSNYVHISVQNYVTARQRLIYEPLIFYIERGKVL